MPALVEGFNFNPPRRFLSLTMALTNHHSDRYRYRHIDTTLLLLQDLFQRQESPHQLVILPRLRRNRKR